MIDLRTVQVSINRFSVKRSHALASEFSNSQTKRWNECLKMNKMSNIVDWNCLAEQKISKKNTKTTMGPLRVAQLESAGTEQ